MYEEIADKLEEMILSDEIPVNEKLPSEQALATGFGVSRPVVREALMLLNARGLITQKNGEGTYVSRPTPDAFSQTMNRIAQMSNIDIITLFEVRLVLEVLSAQKAATKASLEDLRVLEDLLEEMKKHRDDDERFAALDSEFHTMIAQIGGNEILFLFVNSLVHQITAMIQKNLTLEGANEDALRYHEKIIQAIRSGEPEKSGDMMHKHIMIALRNAEALAARRDADQA